MRNSHFPIYKLSAYLAFACSNLIALLPLGVVYIWTADSDNLNRFANLPPQSLILPLAIWQRVIGALLSELPVVAFCVGLWQARQCLKTFAGGQIFSQLAVQYLQRFSMWMIVSALGSIVVGALLSVLLSFNNSPGNRHLSIGVSSDQLLLLFFAGLVWVMAGIISEALLVVEENKSFV